MIEVYNINGLNDRLKAIVNYRRFEIQNLISSYGFALITFEGETYKIMAVQQ